MKSVFIKKGNLQAGNNVISWNSEWYGELHFNIVRNAWLSWVTTVTHATSTDGCCNWAQ